MAGRRRLRQLDSSATGGQRLFYQHDPIIFLNGLLQVDFSINLVFRYYQEILRFIHILPNAMRRIPVFVSCPTSLTAEQEKRRKVIIDILDDLQLEPRALGRGDYPKDFPLKEVYVIAKHCAGGVILGFEQICIEQGIRKRNSPEAKKISAENRVLLPTPWNHLEAGILFGLKLPLLIFKEEGIEGGVFDYGITDAFVHTMPPINPSRNKRDELRQVFLKWFSYVSAAYERY